MKIALDDAGVKELTARFGDFHDSVIRGFSSAFTSPTHVSVSLDALALDGTWWRVVLLVNGVGELRLAEGAAIYGNAPSYELATVQPDGTNKRETRTRDYGDLALGSPTNQVIYAAAIHVAAEGVFVDLSPADVVDPSATRDPAEWRKSTFYVLGKSGEATFEPLV